MAVIVFLTHVTWAGPEAAAPEAAVEATISFGSVAEWAMWAIENRELPISFEGSGPVEVPAAPPFRIASSDLTSADAVVAAANARNTQGRFVVQQLGWRTLITTSEVQAADGTWSAPISVLDTVIDLGTPPLDQDVDQAMTSWLVALDAVSPTPLLFGNTPSGNIPCPVGGRGAARDLLAQILDCYSARSKLWAVGWTSAGTWVTFRSVDDPEQPSLATPEAMRTWYRAKVGLPPLTSE